MIFSQRRRVDSAEYTQPMLGKNHNSLSITKISGERNGRSKLKEKDILLIREFWNSNKYQQKELAIMFNVKVGCIFKIIHRVTWKNI